jgi:hypothetical protein
VKREPEASATATATMATARIRLLGAARAGTRGSDVESGSP